MALRHLVVALAVAGALAPLAFVAAPVRVEHLSEALGLVLLPLALVVGAVRPGALAFAVAPVAEPLAFVGAARLVEVLFDLLGRLDLRLFCRHLPTYFY